MLLSRKVGGRPFLLAGFGSLLLLMVVAGGYALGTLEQVRANDLEERNTHLQRDRALDRVQTGIYQSAIIMRDYLLAQGQARLQDKPIEKSQLPRKSKGSANRATKPTGAGRMRHAHRSSRKRCPARTEARSSRSTGSCWPLLPRSRPKTGSFEAQSTCLNKSASIARS